MSIEDQKSLRIAVDIGGTFTDMACFDETSGEIKFGKALSTHGHLHEGIQNTLDSAAIDLANGYLFLHGSTIAINIWSTKCIINTKYIFLNIFVFWYKGVIKLLLYWL